MTRTELNTSISNILNNAVADGSVTPEMEANAIKLVADYVDGLTINKIKKTTVTSDQILNIFTTPIEIVPAIAGKIILPTNILIIVKYNSSTYSDVGGSWKIRYGSTSLAIATLISYLGSATFDKETIQTLFYSAFTTSGSFVNSPILLTTTGNNPVGGDSNIDVYVTYSEITL